MNITDHIRRIQTEAQLEPEPLLEAICLCGPTHVQVAVRLGVSPVAVSRWSTGQRPLPAARRSQIEALAREVFTTALDETRTLVLKNHRVVRTEGYRRWLARLERAGKLLREAGVEVE